MVAEEGVFGCQSQDEASRIIAEVKDSLKDWKTVARRLGLPERDIDIFAGRFIIG